MGIRLYPNTTPEVIERLIGVPAGTYNRFKEYEAKRPTKPGPTMDAWYEGLFNDNALHLISSFITFGWGRLTSEALTYKKEYFPDSEYAGSTDNPQLAQGMIQAMGITAEGVTSVRWS